MLLGRDRRRSPPLALLVFAGVVAACSSSPRPVDLLDGGSCLLVVDAGPSRLSAGCAAPSPVTGVLDLVDAGLGFATGILVVPPTDAGVPLPLVWAFHGAGENGSRMRAMLQLDPVVDGGAILVYPHATGSTWDLANEGPDLAHFRDATEALARRYCIDLDRLFIVGFSAGAVFTHQAGCNAAGAIRGLAAIAGTDDRLDQSCCSRSRSAILVHGQADPVITFEQGEATRDDLLSTDGCSKTPVPLDANCVEYPGCKDGRAVVWCTHPGGHEIPAFAADEIWRFFSRFR